jgi:hypothetical protein
MCDSNEIRTHELDIWAAATRSQPQESASLDLLFVDMYMMNLCYGIQQVRDVY